MILVLLLVAARVTAQEEDTALGPMDEGVPTYVCERTVGPIKIDGKLDDKTWQVASWTRRFVFPWPEQAGEKHRTRAKLLWNDEALYVAYECIDSDITAVYTRRDDPTYQDDCVEIFLNPAPGKTSFYYGFEMSARAVMYDYFYAWPTCLLTHFDCTGWKLATDIVGTLNDSSDVDSRWTLEVKIPFANFLALRESPPQHGERWRMQLNRWDGTGDKRVLSEWTPSGLDQPHPHRPAGFGILSFSHQR
ncbi:MAG: carbohydrate-binding family 9-like protein [Candidatus Zipacnadales bacterium]